MATGTQVSVATEGLITPKQWLANYHPTYIKGYLWQGRYIGFFTNTVPNPDVFGGFIFDPRGGKNAFIELTQTSTTDVAGGFTDPDDNELYLIANQASGNDIIQKFQGSTTNKEFTWKSKEYVPPKPTSMGFLKVDADAYPVTVKVYGNGSTIPFYTGTIETPGAALAYKVSGSFLGKTIDEGGTATNFADIDIDDSVVRLPPRKHNSFSIEITAAKIVNEVCIAESIAEIRAL